MKSNNLKISAGMLISLLGLLIFAQGLNIHGIEYRDDEIFYFKSTQEMVRSGDWISPTYFGEDRFQKPALFYWLIVLSYKIFGINWFAARFVSAGFAALTVFITWKLAKDLFPASIAHLSALILITFPLFFRHARNVVPDMALNFFIVLAVFYFVRFLSTKEGKWQWLFYISCALGFLIKGFAAVLVPFMTVISYAFFSRQISLLKEMKFGKGILWLLAIILPWFLLMIRRHGIPYLEFMLVDETKNRLMDVSAPTSLFHWLQQFGRHALFYGGVILANFIPFGIMGVAGLAEFLFNPREESILRPRLLLACWMIGAYLFFSSMYFTISHYMLVLSAPLAMMSGAFLLSKPLSSAARPRFKEAMQKYYLIVIYVIWAAAFYFISLFILKANSWQMVSLASLLILGLWGSMFCRAGLIGPVILAVLIIFIYSRTPQLSLAGLTSHAALQKMARSINSDNRSNAVISVGSHDIHEKEFQVYFDRQVIKSGHSHEPLNQQNLDELFKSDQKVYCLILKNDYDKFLSGYDPSAREIIQREYIVRKRLHLDKGFLLALGRLDRKTVYQYLMEEVFLVKKDNHV